MSNKRKSSEEEDGQDASLPPLIAADAQLILTEQLKETKYSKGIQFLSQWFESNCAALILEYTRMTLHPSVLDFKGERPAKKSLDELSAGVVAERAKVTLQNNNEETFLKECIRFQQALRLGFTETKTETLEHTLAETLTSAEQALSQTRLYQDALNETSRSVSNAVARLDEFDRVCIYTYLPTPVRRVMFELFRTSNPLSLACWKVEGVDKVFIECGRIQATMEIHQRCCVVSSTSKEGFMDAFKTCHSNDRQDSSGRAALAWSLQRYVEQETDCKHEWIKTVNPSVLGEFNYELFGDLLRSGHFLDEILVLLTMIRTAGDIDAFAYSPARKYGYVHLELLRNQFDTRQLLTGVTTAGASRSKKLKA